MNVDVVITTTGRPELARAVRSALAQTLRPAKVVVVLDDPSMYPSVDAAVGGDAEVIVTSGRIGGAAARNHGTRACEATYVAYLDDDDEWMPTKLEAQVRRAEVAGAALTTCKAHLVSGTSTREVPTGPFPTRGEDVLGYMVLRPGLRYGWGVIQTSCLLVQRTVALDVRWNETLPKHQDWDFVARVCSETSAAPQLVEEPLVRIYQGTTGSISKRHSWETSLRFIEAHWDRLSRQARGDFVATQVLRGALARGDMHGVWRSVTLLAQASPHLAALIVGMSGCADYLDEFVRRRESWWRPRHSK